MAVVGLPNVGKSSFFNAVCKVSIPAENFPFCTIDPNEAKVEVPVRCAVVAAACQCSRGSRDGAVASRTSASRIS